MDKNSKAGKKWDLKRFLDVIVKKCSGSTSTTALVGRRGNTELGEDDICLRSISKNIFYYWIFLKIEMPDWKNRQGRRVGQILNF